MLIEERVPIKVTQEDIEHGERGSCRRCPVALSIERALERKLEEKVEVYVYIHEIVVYTCNPFPDTVICRQLRPGNVDWFISRFDNGLDALPFEFDLTIKREV